MISGMAQNSHSIKSSTNPLASDSSGKAMIGIYETHQHQLEYRHGKTHWNMLQDKYPAIQMGEILVDKPVLLNTKYLHDVRVVEAPRAIFCFAWRGINKTYNEFKEHVEKTYS